MSEPKKSSSIAWLFGIAVFFLAVGAFSGWGYRDRQFQKYANEAAGKIDSLTQKNRILYDSIHVISGNVKTVDRVITKYRTLYDTVRLQTDLSLIIKGLNEIANTPPN